MDFRNYQGDSGNEEIHIPDGVKNGIRKAGRAGTGIVRKVGRSIGKQVARKAKQGAAKLIKIIGSLLTPKVIIITVAIVFLVLFMLSSLYTCNFFLTGETDGKNKNYIEDNKSSSSNSPKEILSEIRAGEVQRVAASKKKNTTSGQNQTTEETLSTANAVCLSYYTVVSREKSAWQEHENKNGKVELIQNGSTDAVKDAFGNDENYYINPNLLFAMNKYLYQNDYVYPEAFLKPVAYEKSNKGKYKLVSLTDKDGKVKVKSKMYTSDGQIIANQTSKNVGDYGLGTVFIYKEKQKKTILKGTYNKEDYYDSTTGEVKQRDINEDFSIELESQTENVIGTVITFCGVVDYSYKKDTSLKTPVSDGTSQNENDNVTKIYYDTVTITRYIARGPGGAVKYFSSSKEAEDFAKTNPVFSVEKTADGKYKTETKTHDLYKYRRSDSGIYESFVKMKKADVRDENTNYLYDYLQNFATYKPVMTRSYDTFKGFSSGASVGELTTATLKSGTALGTGSNAFEQLYNGGKKKVIEEIWDILINYGFSEEQTSAILGNMCLESGFDENVTNSIGAFGLCQWLSGRKQQLYDFAKAYNKEKTPSVKSQVQFAAMEALGKGTYTDDQWAGNDTAKSVFFSSNNVDELAEAWDTGFERSGGAGVASRQKFARSAYSLLSGRKVKKNTSIVVDNSSTSNRKGSVSLGAAKALSEKETEEYNKFYHMVDDIYGGKYVLNLYYGGLTREKAELVIKTANSYINGTTLTEESLRIKNQMWSEKYLSDLTQNQIYNSNKATNTAGGSDGTILAVSNDEYLVPVENYTVTDEYGPRTSPTPGASTDHKGIDLACAYGTPVMAAKDGTVITAEYGNSGGNYLIIDHGNDKNGVNIWTMYLHNSKLCVKVGDKVKKGQKIAEAGSTGASTGVHCHLSVFENGVYVNPRKYFNIQ